VEGWGAECKDTCGACGAVDAIGRDGIKCGLSSYRCLKWIEPQ
jgi:hypothetical protein